MCRAAAQTLPDDTPQGATLIHISFPVAALSLLVQGGAIGALLKRITLVVDAAAVAAQEAAERTRIIELLRGSLDQVPAPARLDGQARWESLRNAQAHQLAVSEVQRSALLDARDHGTFGADILESELANLDAAQIAIQMRGGA